MLAKLLGNVALDGGQDQRPDSSIRRYPYTGIREFYGILVGDFEGQPSLKNVEKDWRNLRPALEFCGFETSNEHCKMGNINSEEAKAFIGKYVGIILAYNFVEICRCYELFCSSLNFRNIGCQGSSKRFGYDLLVIIKSWFHEGQHASCSVF